MPTVAISKGVANVAFSPSHSHTVISDLSSRMRDKSSASLVFNGHSDPQFAG